MSDQRPPPAQPEPYNIIPVHGDHPSLRAATAAFRSVGDLRKPPSWLPGYDLLDWLGLFFGFQRDNVRNQREHLLLHLANSQMSLHPHSDDLHPSILRRFRRRLLRNYSLWCSFLSRSSSVWVFDSSPSRDYDLRRDLLYVSLYLLVWGESANLRFAPECICYIFHHMALELNKILEDYVDHNTGMSFVPSVYGENAFLDQVVKPIYDTISNEVASGKNGTAPHSEWRNYDDINEYFWSRRCFETLKWPINRDSSFFVVSGRNRQVGKTGFVEQRSFWSLFRSFDRLWVMLFLFLQAAIMLAWEQENRNHEYPWETLIRSRDLQVKLLTVFLTWSGMRFLQSILDVSMHHMLISRETPWVFMRMVMKSLISAVWLVMFGALYRNIWVQRNRDNGWSNEANQQIIKFVIAGAVFLIPEMLEMALFIIPWVRNFIEGRNGRLCYMFTWWFQTRIFVGRGLREGLIDNLKYSLFWIMVLATKFSFSYLLQIRPMMHPTRALLNLNNVNYEWHEFFSNQSNKVAIVVLWLPVVLIYLMDMQIWYSIYSSLVGATVGLFDHLGEIRSMEQLRWRFQFFASAVQFNLVPEERLLNESGIWSNFKDAIRRLKLRYGFGRPYKKLEANQVEANKFALIWNEIIITFREEDIISDKEVELLELPRNTWNVSVMRWPCVLLCNELLLALGQAKELVDAPDKWLWYKISKHEYRRCAVIETYECIKHLLSTIVKNDTEEHSIVMVFFEEVDNSIQIERFTNNYNLCAVPKIHEKLISLVKLLMQPKKIDLINVVNALQALYEIVIQDFYKERRTNEQLIEDGLAPRLGSRNSLLFENAIELPSATNGIFYREARRLHTILTSKDSMNTVPQNLEARRRIAFFSNSVFMNMSHAPPVEKMLAFSVMTPYYNEEVMYTKEQLQRETEDGVSTLYYLQTIYDDEWENFMERMRREGVANVKEIWGSNLRDVRLWASYRGQTLARTIRGMMYYYRALKMLAFLDSASEVDIKERLAKLFSPRQLYKGDENGIALMKYTYVVACQIYGAQKAEKKPQAEEILILMKNNEALRVAYVDEVLIGRNEKEYYSVLVKYDQQLEREVELYRVKLPGPIKLGEGKPENQNHALIFTRGDAVQTIDMNQDNYFEEALKMRNLLEEFKHRYGIRKPTILGVREHIFTGSVSSLAWFMSAQETSFVTLGQRVLANPLKVRMHYGHPDVFDRFWFLTRGGISKASRVINISEDIFAGFNCTLRGGNVTHHEYIQVGKGRDVGLNQIAMFEAKVSSGNGEQVLSRDVYRLGHRLDFFRMLSFFNTTVGFYFNTMLVVLTVYAFLWGRLYLCLSGIESSIVKDNTTSNKALAAILNQQFIIQLGLFTALPMVVENSIEHGFHNAIWDLITMQLQLSSIFFTFSMGTKTHYFGRTILHGGAKYRATGRGFVVEHKSFADNYRLYARSHFVKAIELGLILIIYAVYSPVAKGTFVYIALTVSSWFLVMSWIMAPFVFNPSGFDWLKTVYDFNHFMEWIWNQGGVLVKPEQSWEAWWNEEQDHLRTTGLLGKAMEVTLDLRFFFFQYGIVYHLGIADGSRSIFVYLLSWIYIFVVVVVFVVVSYVRDKYSAKDHIYFRVVQSLVTILIVLVMGLMFEFTPLEFSDIFTSLMAFLPTGWGFISIALVFRQFLQCYGMWNTIMEMARMYDMIFGVVVMAPVAALSWTPGFQAMQTRILFNTAFSRGLRISQILTSKKW